MSTLQSPPLYTLRRFLGRQPLWGMGVTSSMDLTIRPACCRAVIALSLPLPGPLILTSISLMPNFIAFSAACWAAIWPAKGVLFRLPLKLHVPPVAQHRVSPFVSVIVTVVLLKDALIWAIPAATLRLILRFFVVVVFAILFFVSSRFACFECLTCKHYN